MKREEKPIHVTVVVVADGSPRPDIFVRVMSKKSLRKLRKLIDSES